jgi:hypothetical protein
MPATMAIRVLDTLDAARFQRLRLEALQETPTAFASSYSQEADTPLTEIALRLKPDQDWSWVLGGFIGPEELVGMVGLRRAYETEQLDAGCPRLSIFSLP